MVLEQSLARFRVASFPKLEQSTVRGYIRFTINNFLFRVSSRSFRRQRSSVAVAVSGEEKDVASIRPAFAKQPCKKPRSTHLTLGLTNYILLWGSLS